MPDRLKTKQGGRLRADHTPDDFWTHEGRPIISGNARQRLADAANHRERQAYEEALAQARMESEGSLMTLGPNQGRMQLPGGGLMQQAAPMDPAPGGFAPPPPAPGGIMPMDTSIPPLPQIPGAEPTPFAGIDPSLAPPAAGAGEKDLLAWFDRYRAAGLGGGAGAPPVTEIPGRGGNKGFGPRRGQTMGQYLTGTDAFDPLGANIHSLLTLGQPRATKQPSSDGVTSPEPFMPDPSTEPGWNLTPDELGGAPAAPADAAWSSPHPDLEAAGGGQGIQSFLMYGPDGPSEEDLAAANPTDPIAANAGRGPDDHLFDLSDVQGMRAKIAELKRKGHNFVAGEHAENPGKLTVRDLGPPKPVSDLERKAARAGMSAEDYAGIPNEYATNPATGLPYREGRPSAELQRFRHRRGRNKMTGTLSGLPKDDFVNSAERTKDLAAERATVIMNMQPEQLRQALQAHWQQTQGRTLNEGELMQAMAALYKMGGR